MHVDVIYIQKIKSPIWIPQQWSVKTPYMYLGVPGGHWPAGKSREQVLITRPAEILQWSGQRHIDQLAVILQK